MPKEAKSESSVSMETMRTGVGDIDTITVAPRGDTEVELPAQDGGDENGVQVTDKVAAREEGADGNQADEGGGEENRNLSDDVGDRPKKKPFRKTRDGRINELTREKGEWERTATDYKTELEAERARSAALEREKKVSDYAAVLHYRDKLKGDSNELTRALKDAKDTADTAKEAEITAKMASVAAELSSSDNWIKANKPPEVPEPGGERAEADAAPKPKPAAGNGAEQKVTYTGEAGRWVSENPWFTPGSPDYDEGMARYAKNYATMIETELQRIGNEKAIGSPEYFDLIDARMREAYADRFGEGGEEEAPAKSNGSGQPVMRGGSGVVPARASAPGTVQRTQPATNPNQIKLTQEQREVAHSLILRKPDGSSMSNREKEIKYAEGLRSTMKKGA